MKSLLRTTYRDPITAFHSFNGADPHALSLRDFLRHPVIPLRVGCGPDDLESYLMREAVFETRSGLLDFQAFKKIFFPHATLINLEEEAAVNLKEKQERKGISQLRQRIEKEQKEKTVAVRNKMF